MLVLYKFHNCNKFKVTLEDLFSLADIKHNAEYRLKFLHQLTKKKLIDIDDQGKRIVKFSDDESEVNITIKRFDNLILHYLYYLGEEKIKWCEECGENLIRIKNNKVKYCKVCARKININKTVKNRKRKSLK